MSSSPLPVILAGALAIVAVASGCNSTTDGSFSSSNAGTAVRTAIAQPFTRILGANTSGFTEAVEAVLRDQAALQSAWRTLHDGVPGNPPPALDLASTMVVVLALGPRNTAGYGIRADSVTSSAENLTVHYTVTSPGPGCMNAQMMTSPVDVISIARASGQVRFIRETVIKQC